VSNIPWRHLLGPVSTKKDRGFQRWKKERWRKASASGAPQPGASTATLSGTPRQACEATLCLSSGSRPAACTPSLQTYFSIKGKDPQETLEKRKDFLRACPSGAYAGREGHLDVLVRGQPLCDPSTLVAALNAGRYTAIPSQCRAYADHPLTYGIELPVSRRYCDDGRIFLNGRMQRVCVDHWSMPGETPSQAVIQAHLQRERARLRGQPSAFD
jgi:hypothetical protein